MEIIESISRSVTPENGVTRELALALSEVHGEDIFELFRVTARLRRAASGNRVYLCSIVNAKSGKCPEDCSFCAQSAHYRTGIESWPLMSAEGIEEVARASIDNRAGEFSIVTSGKGVAGEDEIAGIERAVSLVSGLGIHSCVSPGLVEAETLARWKKAGLSRFHHNLETSRSFFNNICTTHDYDEDVEAVRKAKALGLEVCCGGIFGLGESWEQRVELAMTLRDLDVDSVPVNFLNPIEGTPMADKAPGITPLEALKTVALMRLAMPRARIVLCGGREVNLRDLQAFMFEAGANGILIGNYLTTRGRPAEEDLRLIADLGMEAAPP